MIKAIGSPLLGLALQTRSDCESPRKLSIVIWLMVYSIGESAKHAFASNPKNTVFDAKRLIGRRMDDREVVEDLKHL
jgi:molecular chaperone DnaK (HSP70)